jgi:hypothetical protein
MNFSFFGKVPQSRAHSAPEARPPKSDLAKRFFFLPRIRTTSHPHPNNMAAARPTDTDGRRQTKPPGRTTSTMPGSLDRNVWHDGRPSGRDPIETGSMSISWDQPALLDFAWWNAEDSEKML